MIKDFFDGEEVEYKGAKFKYENFSVYRDGAKVFDRSFLSEGFIDGKRELKDQPAVIACLFAGGTVIRNFQENPVCLRQNNT